MSEDNDHSDRISSLETAVAELTDILKKLNTGGPTESSGSDAGNSGNANNDTTAGTEHENTAEETSASGLTDQSQPAAIEFPGVQKEYTNIRDTLNRVKLPNNQRLNESGLGVAKKDRAAFTVIQKNSRYLETGLKLLQVAKDDEKVHQSEVAQYLAQIEVILQASLEYNQQEYQAILVGGQFDQDTTKFFRVMQKSEQCFTPQALNNLKLAAEIAAVSHNRESAAASAAPFYRGRGRAYNNYYGGRSGGWYDRQQSSGRGYQYNNRGRPPMYPPNHNSDQN